MSSRLEVLENNFKKNGGCFKEVKVGKYFTKINTPRKKDFNKASDTRGTVAKLAMRQPFITKPESWILSN